MMPKPIAKNTWTVWIERLLVAVLLLLIIKLAFVTFTGTMDAMHSDLANEIAYKKAVAESGSLLPEGWYHANELHLNRPLFIFVPLYWMTKNVLLSHEVSVVIGMLLQLVALTYLTRQLEFSRQATLTTLILYLGYNSLSEILFITFDAYAGFALAIFISLGLMQSLKNLPLKPFKEYLIDYRVLIKLLILFLIAIYMGIGSPKLTVLIYAPLLLTEAFPYIIKHVKQKKFSLDYSLFFILLDAFLILMNLVAYVCSYILGALFSSVPISAAPLMDQFSWENIALRMQEILLALGLAPAENLTSSYGIYYLMTIIFIIASVVFIAIILRYNNNQAHKKLAFFFLMALLLMLFYQLITYFPSLSPRYFCTITILLPVVFGITVQMCIDNSTWLAKPLILTIIVIALYPQLINYTPSQVPISSKQKIDDFQMVADYIKDNGYEIASASYWNAGLLRAKSDWNLDVQQFYDFQHPTPFYWICDSKVYGEEYNQKKQVIVIGKDEKETSIRSGLLNNATKLMTLDTLELYELPCSPFANLIESVKVGQTKTYNFNEWKAMLQNTQINKLQGTIKLGPDLSGIFGPYLTVTEGTYDIVLEYQTEAAINTVIGVFDVVAEGTLISETNMLSTQQTVTLKDVRFDNSEGVEIRAFCHEGNVIDLISITVLRKN